MGKDPRPELEAKTALHVESGEGAQDQAVSEEKQEGGHARREAGGEGEHADPRRCG